MRWPSFLSLPAAAILAAAPALADEFRCGTQFVREGMPAKDIRDGVAQDVDILDVKKIELLREDH